MAIDGQIAGDLSMRRDVGCNDRRSDGQRFDHGQTESLSKGRHQQRSRMGDELTECWTRQAVGQDYVTMEAAAFLQRAQHRPRIAAG